MPRWSGSVSGPEVPTDVDQEDDRTDHGKDHEKQQVQGQNRYSSLSDRQNEQRRHPRGHIEAGRSRPVSKHRRSKNDSERDRANGEKEVAHGQFPGNDRGDCDRDRVR